MQASPIALAPDVWDAFKHSCDTYGGIGAGYSKDRWEQPLCLIGHAATLGFVDIAMSELGGAVGNDSAVVGLIGDGAANRQERVSWEAYCAHRGIVRGAQEVASG